MSHKNWDVGGGVEGVAAVRLQRDWLNIIWLVASHVTKVGISIIVPVLGVEPKHLHF